jgi:hypothetical protein
MPELIIAEHAFKHGLSADEISYAWENFVRKQYRGAPNEGEIVVVGCDATGRLIEIVAAERPFGIVISHAMRPPTLRILSELGLARRQK